MLSISKTSTTYHSSFSTMEETADNFSTNMPNEGELTDLLSSILNTVSQTEESTLQFSNMNNFNNLQLNESSSLDTQLSECESVQLSEEVQTSQMEVDDNSETEISNTDLQPEIAETQLPDDGLDKLETLNSVISSLLNQVSSSIDDLDLESSISTFVQPEACDSVDNFNNNHDQLDELLNEITSSFTTPSSMTTILETSVPIQNVPKETDTTTSLSQNHIDKEISSNTLQSDEPSTTCNENFTISAMSLVYELVRKTVSIVGEEFETDLDDNDNDCEINIQEDATVINVNNKSTENIPVQTSQNINDNDSETLLPKTAVDINVDNENTEDLNENLAKKSFVFGSFSSSKTVLNKQKHLFYKNANKKLTKQLVKSNILNQTLKLENKKLQNKYQKQLDLHSCAKTTKSIQTDETNESPKLAESSNNLNNLQIDLHKLFEKHYKTISKAICNQKEKISELTDFTINFINNFNGKSCFVNGIDKNHNDSQYSNESQPSDLEPNLPIPNAQNQMTTESQIFFNGLPTNKPTSQTENVVSTTSTVLSVSQNIPLSGFSTNATPKFNLQTSTITTTSAVPLAVAHKSAPKAVKSLPRPQISQQTQQSKPLSSQLSPSEQPETKSNKVTEFQDILAIAAQTADIYETTSPSTGQLEANQSFSKPNTETAVTEQEDEQSLSNLIDGMINFETESVPTQTPSSSSALHFTQPSGLNSISTSQEVASSNLNLVQSLPNTYSLPGAQTYQPQQFSTINGGLTLQQHKNAGPLPPITQIFAHTKSRSNVIGNTFVLPGSLQMSNGNNNNSINTVVEQTYPLSTLNQQSAPISQLNIASLNAQSQLTTHNVNSVNNVLSALPSTAFNIASNQVNPLQMQNFPLVNGGNQQAQKINFVYQMNNNSGNFVLLSPSTPAVATPTNRVFLVQVKNNDKNVFAVNQQANNVFNLPLPANLQSETAIQSLGSQQQNNVQLAMLPNGQSAIVANAPAIDSTLPCRGRPRKVTENQSFLLPLSTTLAANFGLNLPKFPNSTLTMSSAASINSTESVTLQTTNESLNELNLMKTKQNNTTVCVQTNYSELVEKTAIQVMQENEAKELQNTSFSKQLNNSIYQETTKLQTNVLHTDNLKNNVNTSFQLSTNQQTTLPSTQSLLDLSEISSGLAYKQTNASFLSNQSAFPKTDENTSQLGTVENQLINNKTAFELSQVTSTKTSESESSTSADIISALAHLNQDSDTEDEFDEESAIDVKFQLNSTVNNDNLSEENSQSNSCPINPDLTKIDQIIKDTETLLASISYEKACSSTFVDQSIVNIVNGTSSTETLFSTTNDNSLCKEPNQKPELLSDPLFSNMTTNGEPNNEDYQQLNEETSENIISNVDCKTSLSNQNDCKTKLVDMNSTNLAHSSKKRKLSKSDSQLDSEKRTTRQSKDASTPLNGNNSVSSSAECVVKSQKHSHKQEKTDNLKLKESNSLLENQQLQIPDNNNDIFCTPTAATLPEFLVKQEKAWGVENLANGLKIKIFIKSPERQVQPSQPTTLNETSSLNSVQKRKRTTSDRLAANEAIEKHLADNEEDGQSSSETKRRTRLSVVNDQPSSTVSLDNSSQTPLPRVKRPYRKKELTASTETMTPKANSNQNTIVSSSNLDKRGRGRPRKVPLVEKEPNQLLLNESPVKRKRGRPKKIETVQKTL